MAVAPLFVADMDALKLELRLDGLATGSSGSAIVDGATSRARVYIYQRLGTTLVATQVAETEVDNPTTAAEIVRKACSLLEVALVRCRLIEVMPVMLGDASGDAQQAYNDEGVWRQVAPEERNELLARCKAEIEELIELILSEDELGDDLSIRVYGGERAVGDASVAYPAGSIFPAIGVFRGGFWSGYHFNATGIDVRFELGD